MPIAQKLDPIACAHECVLRAMTDAKEFDRVDANSFYEIAIAYSYAQKYAELDDSQRRVMRARIIACTNFDFQCPSLARIAKDTLTKLQRQYPDATASERDAYADILLCENEHITDAYEFCIASTILHQLRESFEYAIA
jgi:hypothetical protein